MRRNILTLSFKNFSQGKSISTKSSQCFCRNVYFVFFYFWFWLCWSSRHTEFVQLWHVAGLQRVFSLQDVGLLPGAGLQSTWIQQLGCAGFSSCGVWVLQLQRVGSVAPRHVGSQFPAQGLNARVPPWKVDSQPPDHQGGLYFVFIVERWFPQILDSCVTGFYALLQHVEYAMSLPFGFHFSDNKSV